MIGSFWSDLSASNLFDKLGGDINGLIENVYGVAPILQQVTRRLAKEAG